MLKIQNLKVALDAESGLVKAIDATTPGFAYQTARATWILPVDRRDAAAGVGSDIIVSNYRLPP